MEAELLSFLQNLNQPGIVQKFTEEKITIRVLQQMNENDLRELVPTIGDRVNLKLFFQSKLKESKKNPDTSVRKRTLLQTLRTKLGVNKEKTNASASSEEGEDEVHSLPDLNLTTKKMARCGNRNAVKKTRLIEIGWMHEGHQIRAQNGGGTRKVHLNRDSLKKDIIKEAKNLFFPEGSSVVGEADCFHFSLADFSKKPFRGFQTIEELYTKTKLNILRFYLMTSSKGKDEVSDADVLSETETNTSVTHSDTSEFSGEETSLKSNSVLLDEVQSEVSTISSPDSMLKVYPETQTVSADYDYNTEITNRQEKVSNSIDVQTFFTVNTPYSYDGEVFLYSTNGNLTSSDLDATLPLPGCVQTFSLKRGNVFEDMNKHFISGNFDIGADRLEVKIISEEGVDSGGVLRDALSEYWQTFYTKHTLGASVKIPTTAHNMRKEQWEAVGNVLILGYKQESYLPIQLSQTFIENCIYGRQPEDDVLLNTFLQFIPGMDRDIFNQSLVDFDSVDNEELVDTLSSYEGRYLPNSGNIRKLLIDISHHQIYQKTLFVTECWSPLFQTYLQPLFGGRELNVIYKDLEVCNRNVLKLCDFPPNPNKAESLTIDAFRHYIKSCSHDKLVALLRFCTGSDLNIGKTIQVRLSPPMPAFQLRPIAHTCGCVLELSSSYDNFLLLREHFDNILDSKVLRMDIV